MRICLWAETPRERAADKVNGWAENRLWYETRILVRAPHVSVTHEMSMGILYCRSPLGKATWAFEVVLSGLPHRGPDMYPRDICLVAASGKAAGSEWNEPLARGLCDPLGEPARPATTAAYASPPSAGTSCRLPSAASSPVKPWLAGPSTNRCPGVGRRLAGSDKPSELENSSACLCSRVAAETRGRLEPHSRIRSDAQGQKHSLR